MSPLRLPWLGEAPDAPFPPADRALREPDGLLAAGGDLSPARLLNAYSHGVFPWFSEGEPPLWWCPDPRAVFRTGAVARARRFRRGLRTSRWVVRADTDFDRVMQTCAEIPRPGQRGTWITRDMLAAYSRLHALGHAHCFEAYDEAGEPVGGVYGVAVGRMFFAESMFSLRADGSKVALAALAHVLEGWRWPLIDAQVGNAHLDSLGAEMWPRAAFLDAVATLTAEAGRPGPWTGAVGELPASALASPAA